MDHRRLLALVAEIQGPLEPAEFHACALAALRRAVPCEWISLNDLGGDPGSVVAIVDPPFSDAWHALYARHAHENPLVARYARTGDGRAYRFSDVGGEELRATRLFTEFYEPIGVAHQIAFTLPHQPDRLLAFALSRRDADFTDAERDLLNAARPFLIDAHRTALAIEALQSELRRDGGERLHARASPHLSARGLTAREAEVACWVAQGRSNQDIATALALSPRTVDKHLERVFGKLAAGSRSEVAALVWALDP